jgi:hypothetical protein
MFTITATVDWVDDSVCQTRVAGHNLPEAAVAELHRWALCLEIGCGEDELASSGWESCPEGPEWTELFDGTYAWILDWNNENVEG